jgi:hypothetical protein
MYNALISKTSVEIVAAICSSANSVVVGVLICTRGDAHFMALQCLLVRTLGANAHRLFRRVAHRLVRRRVRHAHHAILRGIVPAKPVVIPAMVCMFIGIAGLVTGGVKSGLSVTTESGESGSSSPNYPLSGDEGEVTGFLNLHSSFNPRTARSILDDPTSSFDPSEVSGFLDPAFASYPSAVGDFMDPASSFGSSEVSGFLDPVSTFGSSEVSGFLDPASSFDPSEGSLPNDPNQPVGAPEPASILILGMSLLVLAIPNCCSRAPAHRVLR